MVATVRGEVAASELGVTLMHEHVFTLNIEVLENYPEYWDEELRVSDAIAKLEELKSRGCTTVVDLTVLGIGRYMPRVQRVVDAVPGLNVIVATGYYTWHSLPSFFWTRGPGLIQGGTDALITCFVQDIREGITGTGIKAGVLKCATDVHGMTNDVERILRACAVTHRETGVPISTHSNPMPAYRNGLEQQAIFRSEGVDLEHVVIGHSGDTTDIDYLREVMDAGSFIGMDRFGLDLDTACTPDERIDTVVRLCELGYAEKMVLSHDASCFGSFMDPDVKTRLYPNWNFIYLFDTVVPEMLKRGVTQEQLDQMFIDNPRRFFEPVKPY